MLTKVINLTSPSFKQLFFLFSSTNHQPESFKHILEQKIAEQEQLQKTQKILLMQEEGWKINFNDNSIVAAKKTQNYYIQMHTLGKKQKQNNPDDQFKEISIYVKKSNSRTLKAKWLVLKNDFHLNKITFQKEKEHIPGDPDLMNFSLQIKRQIANFFFDLGINEETLTAMSEISTNHENQMYCQWLKKLNEIV